MAKHFLSSSDDELDFVLTAITCSEDQYAVTALIDRALDIHLRLSDFVPFNLKEGRVFKFSLYRFLDEELGLEYCLVSNSSNFEEPNINVQDSGLFSGIDVEESVKLIKEMPKTDYFLLLKGDDLHNYQFKIIDALKKIPEILQVTPVEPHLLASRRNLIF
jgi:hypothetical protein